MKRVLLSLLLCLITRVTSFALIFNGRLLRNKYQDRIILHKRIFKIKGCSIPQLSQDEYRENKIVSPFSKDSSVVVREELELSVDNVNKILDKVRPFLIDDGGNVEVVSVDLDTRNVLLSLVGACSSCSSSTTTMKLGIEKKLREYFPNLGRVTAREVGEKPPVVLSVESLEESLSGVMPAVLALGGKLAILEVDAVKGVVKIQFKGPPRLKLGIEMVLKDNRLIKTIVMED